MKKISKILLPLLFASFTLISCDGLLSVDSNRYVFEDQYGMKSTNDSLYSMFGVFSQLEKLADEYVLLGELRADLMDVTTTSNPYLNEINDFAITSGNPYANKKQYYSVINNCNYIIRNIDTTTVNKNERVMCKVYAATKAIRAWTYMQLALNYKTVIYYSEPLLTLADAEKSYPVLDFNQLADSLIRDIEPFKDSQIYPKPSFGNVYSARLSDSFFPIRFLLGDLYLWTGRYEQAATEYEKLMFENRYVITKDYTSDLIITGGVFSGAWNRLLWDDCFTTGSSEIITNIAASNEFGNEFMIDSLSIDHQLTSSRFAITNWDSQRYMGSATLDSMCDLRKHGSVVSNLAFFSGGTINSFSTIYTKNYLFKFVQMNSRRLVNKRVMPYRVALLYLRYAEAVNRIGKPHLALAVLKNGLNPTIFGSNILPASEMPDSLFKDVRFVNNIGIRSRGLGRADLDAMFTIPEALDSVAKIDYMEDLIVNECALETAFEGNRFHDLMRIAIRRDSTDYLALKVAAKHPNNRDEILGKLRIRDNWYLK